MDAAGLERTIAEYNRHARTGSDPAFGKGGTAYNRFYGDPDIRPNPCIAPIETPPFYAVQVHVGDLGTYAGIVTNANAQALDANRRPIPGLYAVGNDALSIMGGITPAPASPWDLR
ncbi:MAG: FAD-binding protein [Burkholderiales bacterium]|nr:FAD-binding protein [Burkholderiales bacterium]